MMNNSYKPLYQRIQRMQSNMRNTMGTAQPQAYAVHREMNNLLSDMRANRNPSVINSRMKTIQRQMSQARTGAQNSMANGRAMPTAMNRGIQEMRRNVHSFYNFH